jgi:RimJ/RimL family protein N-acetyltransferase
MYWLSYWIAPDLWGRGLATESVAALVWIAFANPEYRRIVALVGETNHKSIAVLRRVGLVQVDEAELPRPVPAYHLAFVIDNSKTCNDTC